MNVLVLWSTMRNAIDVLLKARLQSKNADPKFEADTQATRLNNICLPRVLTDFNVDLFSTREPLKAIEYQNESSAVTTNDDQTKDELETSTGTADEVELAAIVDE